MKFTERQRLALEVGMLMAADFWAQSVRAVAQGYLGTDMTPAAREALIRRWRAEAEAARKLSDAFKSLPAEDNLSLAREIDKRSGHS